MTAPALLAEFFSAALGVLWRFLSHPVLIGSALLVLCITALICLFDYLSRRFPKQKDDFESLEMSAAIVGFFLVLAFVVWAGIGIDTIEAAWRDAWGM